MVKGVINGIKAQFNSSASKQGFLKSSAPWQAFHMTAKGNLIGVPFIALSVASANRGEKLTTAVSEFAGVVTYPVTSFVVTAALSLIPGGRMFSPGIRAFVGTLVAALPNTALTEGLNRGFNKLSKTDQRVRRLAMGGSYQDSANASSQREVAIRDMTMAFRPGRQLLGQEAMLFHQ